MANIQPFQAVRPVPEMAERIAALPYDVYNRKDALVEVTREPMSFLHIDRPETWFDDQVDTYDPKVYQKAAQVLKEWRAAGYFIQEEKPCFYIYEQVMNGRTQTGIVGCASVNEYLNNTIKKHEKTRETKMEDRIRHIEACQAQTGPIFLAYREQSALTQIVDRNRQKAPLYDFTAPDGVTQTVWIIDDEKDILGIEEGFRAVPDVYIADGHHRAASAVSVSLKRRQELGLTPGTPAGDESDFFLCVLFPDEMLKILPYNRVVKDLNGHTTEEFLLALTSSFTLTRLFEQPPQEEGAFPSEKASFGMYLDGCWYLLKTRDEILKAPADPDSDCPQSSGNTRMDDPVKSLDVAILQDYVLEPLLGIVDPRRDERIDFVGGIKGLRGLETYCREENFQVAFAMYPTSIQELFRVADINALMPPKSTWFEPKLRSGLFLHLI